MRYSFLGSHLPIFKIKFGTRDEVAYNHVHQIVSQLVLGLRSSDIFNMAVSLREAQGRI